MATTWASVRNFCAVGLDSRNGAVAASGPEPKHGIRRQEEKQESSETRSKMATACSYSSGKRPAYSTVTDLARFRGWSTSQPSLTAM